jgi:hypothetical protein
MPNARWIVLDLLHHFRFSPIRLRLSDLPVSIAYSKLHKGEIASAGCPRGRGYLTDSILIENV